MSLLNDMLRDLSHQQKAQQMLATTGDEPLYTTASVASANDWQDFQNTPMVKADNHFKLFIIALSSVLVFAVLFAGLVALKNTYTEVSVISEAPTVDASSVVTEHDNAVTADPNLPAKMNDETEVSAINTATELEPDIKPSVNNDVQLKIYDLLEAATRAFTVDRLTTPADDNAYRYYQEILALDSENPVAKKGLENIADRYLAMAELKLQNADVDRAELLIQRAQQVLPNSEKITFYRDRLSQVKAEHSGASMAGAEKNLADPASDNTNAIGEGVLDEPSMTNEVVPISVENNAVENPAAQTLTSVSIKEPFAGSSEQQHLTVAPNAHWQEQQVAQQVQRLIDGNQIAAATTVLTNYIDTAEKPVITTALLLDIYAQQSAIQTMESLLVKATYLPSVEHTYYSAKLALLKSNENEAVQLLEEHLSEAEAYESYRSLLAGLYQSAGRYSEAANHYRRLINAFGNKPAYWLGFALSLDGLNQKASALQAYQRLSEFPNIQEEVRQYIDQRIKELTP